LVLSYFYLDSLSLKVTVFVSIQSQDSIFTVVVLRPGILVSSIKIIISRSWCYCIGLITGIDILSLAVSKS